MNDELLLKKVKELLKDHVPDCKVCVIGHDSIVVCEEMKKEIMHIGLDQVMRDSAPKDVHEYILSAPIVEMPVMPSRKRQPWSKRNKGGFNVRDNLKPPRK